MRMTVVSAVTISSTNMTGFLISVRGSSLTKAEPIAGTTIFGSSSAETGMRLRSFEVSMEVTPDQIRSERRAGGHREMLDDGSERERREEGEAADDQDHADDQADEQPARGRERAGRRRDRLLLGASEPAIAIAGMIIQKRPTNIATAPRDVVEERVAGEAGEGRAVVAGAEV